MAASFKCFALLLLCVTSFTNGGITIIKNAFSLPNKVDTGVTLSGRTLKYQCRHLQPAFGPLTAVCQTITKCPPGSVQARVKSSVPQQFTAKTALYHVDWQCEGDNRIILVDYQPEKGTVGLKDANNGSTVIRQDTPYFATCAFFEDKAKKNIVECYNYEYCSYRLGKLVCAGIPAYGGTWTGDIKTELNGKFDAIMQPNRNKTCNQDLPAVLGKEQKANAKAEAQPKKPKCSCKQARDELFIPLALDSLGPSCTSDGKYAKLQLSPRGTTVGCVDENNNPTTPAVNVPAEAIPACK